MTLFAFVSGSKTIPAVFGKTHGFGYGGQGCALPFDGWRRWKWDWYESIIKVEICQWPIRNSMEQIGKISLKKSYFSSWIVSVRVEVSICSCLNYFLTFPGMNRAHAAGKLGFEADPGLGKFPISGDSRCDVADPLATTAALLRWIQRVPADCVPEVGLRLQPPNGGHARLHRINVWYTYIPYVCMPCLITY